METQAMKTRTEEVPDDVRMEEQARTEHARKRIIKAINRLDEPYLRGVADGLDEELRDRVRSEMKAEEVLRADEASGGGAAAVEDVQAEDGKPDSRVRDPIFTANMAFAGIRDDADRLARLAEAIDVVCEKYEDSDEPVATGRDVTIIAYLAELLSRDLKEIAGEADEAAHMLYEHSNAKDADKAPSDSRDEAG